MRQRTILFLLAVVLLGWAAAAGADSYSIDPAHSSLAFDIRHFVSKVPGRFKDFEGTIAYDPTSPAATTVEITARAESIDTDNDRRDQHLRSPDFFHVEQFPTLSFKSKKVAADGANRLEVTGDLTIHGVTKEVTVPVDVLGTFQMPDGSAKAGFETTFTIDRKQFGIEWNRVLDQGGAVLGDDVNIHVAIEANRAAPETAQGSGR